MEKTDDEAKEKLREKKSDEEDKISEELKILKKKAKNYFILGKIGEILNMYSEAGSNYFKSLSAVNDFILSKIDLEPKDHRERFSMLKENFPEFYKITDSLFTVYRRAYTSELNKEEILRLREKIKEAFENAKIKVPGNSEDKKEVKK